jgi:hypothetical protein
VTTIALSAMRLREATTLELAGWDALVRRFTNHRIVHTSAWVRSLEASGFGHPLFLVFEKEGDIVACLPGLVSDVGPFRLFGSPPPASQSASMGPTYDPLRVSTGELMEVAVPFLESRLGVHQMEIMSPDLDPAVMLSLGFRGESWPTCRVQLHPGNESRTFEGFEESARNNIRRGIDLGLRVNLESEMSFVDEHYNQIRDVHARGGHPVSFRHQRVLHCFRSLRDAGNLLAASVYLPEKPVSIASGIFMVEEKELLLWTWAHRPKHREYRATELMTWTVMQRAMSLGCDTFDLMGLGDLKTKFGAELDNRKYRWVRSRYRWLSGMRDLATRGLQWQEAVRGRVARWGTLSATRRKGWQ